MIIRLVLMAHHYRADWEWSEAELDRAAERLRAYRSAAARGGHHPATVEALRAALRQDLYTPAALETLDAWASGRGGQDRSEEHTSELQSRGQLVCRLLLEIQNTGYDTVILL